MAELSPPAPDAVFVVALLALLRVMVPSEVIARVAGVEPGDGMAAALAASHRIYLQDTWRRAHEAVAAIAPSPREQPLHHRAVTASRAYGMTVAVFADLAAMQVANMMGTAGYLRTRENGRDWDRLTSEAVRALLGEVDRDALGQTVTVAARDQGVSFRALRKMAEGTTDVMGEMGFGAVASFV